MTILEQIKILAGELNLSFETQDWGIINATPGRTGEFIDYFNENDLSDVMKYQLLELILASFNEAQLEGNSHEELNNKLVDLYRSNEKNEVLKPLFKYWKSLNGEDFPVAAWLNASYG